MRPPGSTPAHDFRLCTWNTNQTLPIQFQNQIKQIVERGTIDALSLHMHMAAHFPGFVGHFNNK